MTVVALDHVQLAMPGGGEAKARAFFCDLLGFEEQEKPPGLAGAGGLWLASRSVRLHLGIDEAFRPARKAHPCFAVDDLDALGHVLRRHGFAVEPDTRIQDVLRFFTNDPFGNRIEFMETVRPVL